MLEVRLQSFVGLLAAVHNGSASRSLHPGAHVHEDLVDRVEADPP